MEIEAIAEKLKKDKEIEEKLVKEMLERFCIASEESTTNDRIDIRLLLKAMPIEINLLRLHQVTKFNFLYL